VARAANLRSLEAECDLGHETSGWLAEVESKIRVKSGEMSIDGCARRATLLFSTFVVFF